ncbi:integral membrane protein [Histoplasma capsulatum G186AR]|uniref:Integral membrane protein n=2 Tax=Ajellomyces capsulatus TaxID=5037 RepID=C0NH83_AJECG|nr:uncharacterized protein HCBG_02705 [Histoplasma capsulatum G186AR]EEH09168.1 integral membrane protein [Histoplasma capsulatum G186AR]
MLRTATPFVAPNRALCYLLFLAVAVIAHGDDAGHGMEMDMDGDGGGSDSAGEHSSNNNGPTPSDGSSPMSYFAYQEHAGSIVAHIVLMVIAWFFILPIGVMLSVARSRLALPTQFSFLIVNAFGLLLAAVYNNQVPNLYENNVHHKIGWIVTWVMVAEVVMGLLFAYSGGRRDADTLAGPPYERVAFLPVPTTDHPQHESYPAAPYHQYRWSGDSGQGSERNTSSLRSHSCSPERGRRLSRPGDSDEFEEKPDDEINNNGELPAATSRVFWSGFVDKFLSRRVPGLLSRRALDIMNVFYVAIERTILILGFIAIATGAVVYGGIFRGNDVFNGLAHFIKGGIFFWYGLLTLGRWMGCFADLGWAWNIKPSRDMVGRWRARVPSGEFTESFVIFLYGASNVFLEHLAAWGEAWTAQDLEHVSISVMFFGGGLCGMLVESKRVRDWMNTAIFAPTGHSEGVPSEVVEVPKSQRVPLNPIPGLIILLLGLMMSSHHQSSMVSTMVHKQWGMLLVGFSLSRAVTYILLCLRPPTSLLPYRPPSELIASFCLISGGLIFMLSTRNIVDAMDHYDLNAMFVFTVAMGFTSFVMAWEILCISIKAWATKKSALAIPPPASTYRFPA